MKSVVPICSNTIVSEETKEWFPGSFEDFLQELNCIESLFNGRENLLVFRGHRKRQWLLDSTFVRSCKSILFGFEIHSKLPVRLAQSLDLHRALLNLFLLKFGTIVRPSSELYELGKARKIDPWFELMKRIQQHPDEKQDGPFPIRGTNLLDWTKSSDVALFFANDGRRETGRSTFVMQQRPARPCR